MTATLRFIEYSTKFGLEIKTFVDEVSTGSRFIKNPGSAILKISDFYLYINKN